MRNEPNIRIEKYRDNSNEKLKSPRGVNYGMFLIPKGRAFLRVISSGNENGTGWEHVSVSLGYRCPTWDEMAFVKNLFWRDDETVVEFHPKKSKYINRMPFCLHMWKMVGADYKLPPEIFV